MRERELERDAERRETLRERELATCSVGPE